MDQPRKELTICMGSSCFSRGNKQLLQLIKEYLDDKNLSEVVTFKGAHCMGQCDKGPTIKIDDTYFQNVDNKMITGMLDAYFFPEKH